MFNFNELLFFINYLINKFDLFGIAKFANYLGMPDYLDHLPLRSCRFKRVEKVKKAIRVRLPEKKSGRRVRLSEFTDD